MMRTRMTMVTLLTCAAVFAQMAPPTGGEHRPGRGFARGIGGAGPGPGGGGCGMHPGKVVTNAPFSAEVSWSRVQTLIDGNTIQHTGSGKMARDTQGRTYNQETFTGGPLGQNGPITRISIFDPVAGFAYELNPTDKTATKRAIRAHIGEGPWSTPQAGSKRPLPPDVATTDLGMQLINGVNAQGTKRTRTVAAGTIGNSQPIVSTTETWYSAELSAVVESKTVDPRFGETNYSLRSVQRGEQPLSLFEIPADYKTGEQKKFLMMNRVDRP